MAYATDITGATNRTPGSGNGSSQDAAAPVTGAGSAPARESRPSNHTHRVWMERSPATARPDDFTLEGGWYGRPPGHVGMDNRAIYWRTTEEHASWMTPETAVATVKLHREKGYRCRCEPPVIVTETF